MIVSVLLQLQLHYLLHYGNISIGYDCCEYDRQDDSYSDQEQFDLRELAGWESNESNTSDPALYESDDDTCVQSS